MRIFPLICLISAVSSSLTSFFKVQIAFKDAPVPVPREVICRSLYSVFHSDEEECKDETRTELFTDGILLKVANIYVNTTSNSLPSDALHKLNEELLNHSYNMFNNGNQGAVLIVPFIDVKYAAYIATPVYVFSMMLIIGLVVYWG